MSYTTIYCSHKTIIHNNVIGGATCIYFIDCHSLTAAHRLSDRDEKIVYRALVIEENIFIGANCTILKGVTIGNNFIVGACSVVARSNPPNEIRAGNPAKFIKSYTP